MKNIKNISIRYLTTTKYLALANESSFNYDIVETD